MSFPDKGLGRNNAQGGPMLVIFAFIFFCGLSKAQMPPSDLNKIVACVKDDACGKWLSKTAYGGSYEVTFVHNRKRFVLLLTDSEHAKRISFWIGSNIGSKTMFETFTDEGLDGRVDSGKGPKGELEFHALKDETPVGTQNNTYWQQRYDQAAADTLAYMTAKKRK